MISSLPRSISLNEIVYLQVDDDTSSEKSFSTIEAQSELSDVETCVSSPFPTGLKRSSSDSELQSWKRFSVEQEVSFKTSENTHDWEILSAEEIQAADKEVQAANAKEAKNWKIVGSILATGAFVNTCLRVALAGSLIGKVSQGIQGLGGPIGEVIDNKFKLENRPISKTINASIFGLSIYAFGPSLTLAWYATSAVVGKASNIAYDVFTKKQGSGAWKLFTASVSQLIFPMVVINLNTSKKAFLRSDSKIHNVWIRIKRTHSK